MKNLKSERIDKMQDLYDSCVLSNDCFIPINMDILEIVMSCCAKSPDFVIDCYSGFNLNSIGFQYRLGWETLRRT
jgi:hypothetical protein